MVEREREMVWRGRTRLAGVVVDEHQRACEAVPQQLRLRPNGLPLQREREREMGRGRGKRLACSRDRGAARNMLTKRERVCVLSKKGNWAATLERAIESSQTHRERRQSDTQSHTVTLSLSHT
jgi:hypothetical protein